MNNLSQKPIPLFPEKLGEELVFDLEFNGEKELWIATRHQGVVIYNLDTKQLLNIEEKLNYTSTIDFKDARRILKASDDKLYIGTDGAGLIIYNNHSKKIAHFTNSSNSHSIASNTIFSIYEDIDENIWLGHIRKGISIINNDKLSP